MLDGNAVGPFFDRHGADIVCLQEVKVARSRLEGGEAMKLGAQEEGWESFWAPCRVETSRGFQGVATFARAGGTVRADANPLRVEALDAQGRCIFTEHAAFGLFNVYAPVGSNAGGLTLRVQFYRALRRAMKRERQATGKPVILCGDLNLNLGTADCHFLRARVHIPSVLDGTKICMCGSSRPGEPCCEFKEELAHAWPRLKAALKTRSTKVEKPRSSATGEVRERYRLVLDVPSVNGATGQAEVEQIKVGKLQDTPEYCMQMFDLCDSWWSDPDTGEQVQVYKGDTLSVGELSELAKTVLKMDWPRWKLQKLAEHAGETPTSLPIQQIMRSLLEEDGMIDSFRELHPSARFRFTCWNQYTNNRYGNQGARIDYFLIDKALQAALINAPASELRCGCGNPNRHRGGLQGEEAARCAVTANGRFQPAAFEGGGLIEATRAAIDSQFGAPHTGLIYTPPKYSDHIAISVLLQADELNTFTTAKGLFDCTLKTSDKATKVAQPHKKQLSIKNFFSAGAKQSQNTPQVSKAALMTSDVKQQALGPTRAKAKSASASDVPSTKSSLKRGGVLHMFEAASKSKRAKDALESWTCSKCTFKGNSTAHCEMCTAPKCPSDLFPST